MIVLVGFMGAGKSTVGRELARRQGMAFVDSDAVIEERAGATVAAIFERAGEPAFRELERDVVAEILSGEDCVVALGGGALTDPVTRAALKAATVVHLDATLETLRARVAGGIDRPLWGSDPDALWRERRRLYDEAGDIVVSTEGRSPEDVADEVAARIGGINALPLETVGVELGPRAYKVVIGAGAAPRLHEFLPALGGAERALVVTHPDLDELASGPTESLAKAGLEVEVAHVPEGEQSKSLPVAMELCERLAAADFHRDDLVVGVGGGVVTDLAGFVASIFHRGMAVVHVPTTLLGQADAAIGGKTAVNLPLGKNLVGTIHQPSLVVCDVGLLAGLPQEEMRSGLAEVIKYGLIAEPSLLDIVRRRIGDLIAGDAVVLDEVVRRSVAVKAGFVAADERDRGLRACLNYGHTFGHAIEHLRGGAVRHGEAVALGMMAAAHLAHAMGRIDEGVVTAHEEALAAAGLPTTAELDLVELERVWQRDKKYQKGVRFVLLAGIGRPEVGISVPRDALERALGRMVP